MLPRVSARASLAAYWAEDSIFCLCIGEACFSSGVWAGTQHCWSGSCYSGLSNRPQATLTPSTLLRKYSRQYPGHGSSVSRLRCAQTLHSAQLNPICFQIFASFMSTFGINLQKYSHMQNLRLPEVCEANGFQLSNSPAAGRAGASEAVLPAVLVVLRSVVLAMLSL